MFASGSSSGYLRGHPARVLMTLSASSLGNRAGFAGPYAGSVVGTGSLASRASLKSCALVA